ncbi:hypothetical protein LCGC14_2991850 [marine sediment metagenome]|uniref:Uncharacterized protein n=1 Tax=marine sediment metagenome TaxID=412755 RepID=A0A0F8XR57_9ZZZZ
MTPLPLGLRPGPRWVTPESPAETPFFLSSHALENLTANHQHALNSPTDSPEEPDYPAGDCGFGQPAVGHGSPLHRVLAGDGRWLSAIRQDGAQWPRAGAGRVATTIGRIFGGAVAQLVGEASEDAF